MSRTIGAWLLAVCCCVLPAGCLSGATAEQGKNMHGDMLGRSCERQGSSDEVRLKKEKADVLIAYDSMTGNTERMAQAVAEGVKRVPGVVASVKRVQEVTKEDLEAADAIVLGCPAYYANIPGRMKIVIDNWSWRMKVDFTNKIGGAFSTGGGQMGGKEHVVISLLLFMINNRMIVAGPLYQDEEGQDIWAEAGAGAMTGPIDPGIGPKELDSANRLGERVACLAVKLEK
jgi:NAD(P)H dehydrogenase (quinone)